MVGCQSKYGLELAARLDVASPNEGDRRLLAAYGRSPMGKRRMKAMHAKGSDPIRREKIAAARRGKPRPKHVIEALRKANVGKHPSKSTRQKMSAAHKRRGTRPPKAGRAWEPWEDKLIRTEPAPAVAKSTGRTLTAIYSRRFELRIKRPS